MKMVVADERLLDLAVDGWLVGMYQDQWPEGFRVLDEALGGLLKTCNEAGTLSGKRGDLTELLTTHAAGVRRLFVLGLGSDPLDAASLADVYADALRSLKDRKGLKSVGIDLRPGDAPENADIQAIVQGVLLGAYEFEGYKKEREATQLQEVHLGLLDGVFDETARSLIREADTLVEATVWARDLANEPGNYLTPREFANRVQSMAESEGLTYKRHDRAALETFGMGLMLGVAQGSQEEPFLVELGYQGSNDESAPTLTLVGKGLTFDSGGISLKPGQGMQDMKMDMGGAAAVAAAMLAIARFKPQGLKVRALLGLVENMPDGGAQKPGDVRIAMDGRSVEIINTDAEGRLVLGDLVAYAVKTLASDFIVDAATLTGSVMVALGDQAAGVVATDDALVEALMNAGDRAGERFWRFPNYDGYKELLKSDIADMKNSGSRSGSAISAGLFIGAFADDTPWAHIDIAGVAWTDKAKGVWAKGGTGFAARTLARLPEALVEVLDRTE